MKRLVYLLVLILTANWTFAQKNTATNAPQTQVKVNKEYDENGNLTRYDSTSVSTWSSDSTFTMMDMDSLDHQMGFFFNDGFNQFFNDSMFLGHGSFEQMQKNLFKHNHIFLDQFGMGNIDSIMNSIHGTQNGFPDLDDMRKQIEEQFKQFFGDDSIHTQFKGVQ